MIPGPGDPSKVKSLSCHVTSAALSHRPSEDPTPSLFCRVCLGVEKDMHPTLALQAGEEGQEVELPYKTLSSSSQTLHQPVMPGHGLLCMRLGNGDFSWALAAPGGDSL